MRTIKFRGQDAISKEFVYGDLIHGVGPKLNNIYILPRVINLASVKNCHPLDGVKVSPETIGQFTGLLDKNGVEIYEGDVTDEGIVVFHEEYLGFFVENNEDDFNPLYDISIIEVIKNIHEND